MINEYRFFLLEFDNYRQSSYDSIELSLLIWIVEKQRQVEQWQQQNHINLI